MKQASVLSISDVVMHTQDMIHSLCCHSTWEYEYFSRNLCNYGFHHVFFNVRQAAVQCNIFKLHFYADQMLWYTPWNKKCFDYNFLTFTPNKLTLTSLVEKICYLSSKLSRILSYFVLRFIWVETNPMFVCVYAAHIISAISLITYQTSQLSDLIKEKFSSQDRMTLLIYQEFLF